MPDGVGGAASEVAAPSLGVSASCEEPLCIDCDVCSSGVGTSMVNAVVCTVCCLSLSARNEAGEPLDDAFTSSGVATDLMSQ